MTAWLLRHVQTSLGTLGRLWSQRVSTLLTVMVIGIALALPACLYVLVMNVQAASGSLQRALELSVYVKPGSALTVAEQLAGRIRQRRDVADVRLTDADNALREFRQRSGFGDALDALTDNPLPHTLVVRPVEGFTSATQLTQLATELRSLPEVDVVQLDTAWIDRFNAILDAVRRGVLVVGGLLACGVLIIVGNVIRSEIQSRRPEIEVTKLVGGSDAFVRRPFLYAGIWYGLAGGLLALGVTSLIVALLQPSIRRLAQLYGSGFELAGPDARSSLWLVGAGMALGWLGSLLSASKHLRDVEPR